MGVGGSPASDSTAAAREASTDERTTARGAMPSAGSGTTTERETELPPRLPAAYDAAASSGRRGGTTQARRAAASSVAALLLLAATGQRCWGGGGFGVGSIAEVGGASGGEGWRWEVILDAGSSGTRVHVYHYRVPAGGLLPVVQHPEATLKSEPGLSSLQPHEVSEHLRPLLDFAVKEVPEIHRNSTPVTLLATAGLRLLPDEQSTALLGSVRAQLAGSSFASRAEWTGVLSGQDEGLYGWLAANYGSGILHKRIESLGTRTTPPEGPVGVVELGGASAQVTFERQHAVGGCIVHVNGSLLGSLDLPGVENQLVTNSFLGFGQDMAHEQVARLVQASKDALVFAVSGGVASSKSSDPCMPRGWEDQSAGVVGAGNFSACLRLAQRVIRGACEAHTCTIKGMHPSDRGDKTSSEVEGVTLPRFRGKILAVENFFYTRTVLNLPDEPTLEEVEEAGERYCSTPWHELLATYVDTGIVRREQDILKYCFSAAYIVAFLHNGLGVGRNERRVHFTNSVIDHQGQEVAVRWALGALVMRAAERNRQKETLLEHVRQEVTRQSVAGGLGATGGEQLFSMASTEGGLAASDAEEACDPEGPGCAVAVAFACGAEFCCASALLAQP